jgi:hypothetical protein
MLVTAVSFFDMPLGAIEICGLLLEPNRQPVAFRPVLDPVRPND